jgi:hypothetical protein
MPILVGSISLLAGQVLSEAGQGGGREGEAGREEHQRVLAMRGSRRCVEAGDAADVRHGLRVEGELPEVEQGCCFGLGQVLRSAAGLDQSRVPDGDHQAAIAGGGDPGVGSGVVDQLQSFEADGQLPGWLGQADRLLRCLY